MNTLLWCTVPLVYLEETMFWVFDYALLKVTPEGGPSGLNKQPMYPSNPMTAGYFTLPVLLFIMAMVTINMLLGVFQTRFPSQKPSQSSCHSFLSSDLPTHSFLLMKLGSSFICLFCLKLPCHLGDNYLWNPWELGMGKREGNRPGLCTL